MGHVSKKCYYFSEQFEIQHGCPSLWLVKTFFLFLQNYCMWSLQTLQKYFSRGVQEVLLLFRAIDNPPTKNAWKKMVNKAVTMNTGLSILRKCQPISRAYVIWMPPIIPMENRMQPLLVSKRQLEIYQDFLSNYVSWQEPTICRATRQHLTKIGLIQSAWYAIWNQKH